ncbi:hypothetical protein C8A01DRAFT_51477 [Parachaetomium inaequale]|uniref:Uncharacterized protein n=1 Tax=Parachaetomium inaequale TaxID=2588326 RepID=A0AAN6P805_9PEZI|nr:hypothetical protein C8A01DRAFT_51477 [Parachaetomium inaequale]
MPARCLPQPVAHRNADFVRRFTAKQREAHDDRITKQAKALTADQRAALRKQLDVTEFLPPDYADATKINIASYKLRPLYTLGKDITNVDTLLALLTFNIRYDTSVFPWEGHRTRPAEFVDGETKRGNDDTPSDEDEAPDEDSRLLVQMIALCYEDIQLMVVRYPETGEDVLAISIRLVYYKGVDNKPKLTIFFFIPIRRLIFCFISIIVSLAVYNSVFASSKFTSARKEEWLKRPEESDERKYQPLLYYKLHYDIERQLLDAGEEKAIEPKAWCNASDTVRNQMIRYNPKWAMFNSVYINEKPTEDRLLAMLSYIGLIRDPRASKDMVPDEVWELMPPDPEIEGSENEGKIRELTKLIATKEQQRKTAIRRGYRQYYFYNRLTWDIDADGQEEEEYVEPALAEILCNQPDNLSAAELLELRIQAAELMVILCGKRETVRPRLIRRRAQAQAQADVTVKEESPGPDPFPLLMDRKQCLRYIGDETLSHEERTFKYCRPAVMYDHFDRKHAQQIGGVKQMLCNHPKCKQEALEFKHLNHFKNHIESVHGVKLRA